MDSYSFGNLKKGRFEDKNVIQEWDFWPLIASVCYAVIIMLICSRSSFLYVFNLWDDVNSYFTVGKCIFRGFVPYRDLFDQKGIMLYFIYGLSSLISPTTFRGVLLMEMIAAFFSLWAIHSIYALFLKSSFMPYIMTPITGAIIYSAENFYWGGSAEEFLFPFIMWGLYISVRYFRTEFPKPMDYKTVLAGGLLAGCVLNIKFNSLGFFFAFMMMVFIADIVGKREVKKAFLSCLVFLLGMLIATLPWIIYFGVNGAIYDWGYVYIYKNVFEYSKELSFGERWSLFFDIIKNHALNNKVVFGMIFIGIVVFLIMMLYYAVTGNKTAYNIPVRIMEVINLGVLFFFLILVIFIGGVSLPYYSFPINGFMVFGFIPICYIIEQFMDKKTGKALGIAAVFASALMCWFMSINVRSWDLKKEDLWLYHFRDYIIASGVEDPGLINQFCFDVGLYTVLDIEPICYYFQTQTLNMQEVLDYQKQYLHSGEADFVVTCDMEAEGIDDRYDLVMKERCTFYRFDHTYYLYQRNDNPVVDSGD